MAGRRVVGLGASGLVLHEGHIVFPGRGRDAGFAGAVLGCADPGGEGDDDEDEEEEEE